MENMENNENKENQTAAPAEENKECCCSCCGGKTMAQKLEAFFKSMFWLCGVYTIGMIAFNWYIYIKNSGLGLPNGMINAVSATLYYVIVGALFAVIFYAFGHVIAALDRIEQKLDK